MKSIDISRLRNDYNELKVQYEVAKSKKETALKKLADLGIDKNSIDDEVKKRQNQIAKLEKELEDEYNRISSEISKITGRIGNSK